MGDRDGIFTRKGKPGYYTSYIDANGRRRQVRIHAITKTDAKKIRGAILARVETDCYITRAGFSGGYPSTTRKL